MINIIEIILNISIIVLSKFTIIKKALSMKKIIMASAFLFYMGLEAQNGNAIDSSKDQVEALIDQKISFSKPSDGEGNKDLIISAYLGE